MGNKKMYIFDELELIIKALELMDDIQQGINAGQEGEYPCPKCLNYELVLTAYPDPKAVYKCGNCGTMYHQGFRFDLIAADTVRMRRRLDGIEGNTGNEQPSNS